MLLYKIRLYELKELGEEIQKKLLLDFPEEFLDDEFYFLADGTMIDSWDARNLEKELYSLANKYHVNIEEETL